MLLFNAVTGWSQEFVFPVNTHFSWKAVETKLPRSRIDQFINSVPDEFQYLRRREDRGNMDTLATRLHFLDLNGDGRLDVIFNGEGGGEGRVIWIYMNIDGKYKAVLNEVQYVDKLEWRDNRLYRLYITNPGCCAENRNFNKIYQLTYDKANQPMFIQMYQSEFTAGTKFPDTLTQRPVRFEVLNDSYKLRSAPVIDDSSEQEWNAGRKPFVGNLIGKLAKGSRGWAFARVTDANGREWWYVEMDEEAYPAGLCLGKVEDNAFPTKAIGWVSSRFVKLLP